MKRIASFFALFLSLAFLATGQQLTIEQAIGQTGFYPDVPIMIWGGPAGAYLQVRDDELIATQVKTGKEAVLLTKETLNKVLRESGLETLSPLPLPQVLSDGRFRFTLKEWLVDYDWNRNQITGKLPVPAGSQNLAPSPLSDGVAYTRGANLFWTGKGGAGKHITNDTVDGIVNGQTVSRNEFGISLGIFWSPKGSCVAFYRKDERNVTKYPMVDISKTPAEQVFTRYPMAGGSSELIQVGIYRFSTGLTIFLEETAFGDDRYMTNITWDPEERFLYAAVLNREQNHMMLNQYDASTGKKLRTLFEEKSDKYVEPLHGLYFNPVDPGSFIWISERDGYDHLYLYRTDGHLVRQLTSGNWVITDFAGWDRKGKAVYFTSTEISPLERHFYSVDVATGVRTRLTTESGTHDVLVGPDHKYLIDSYSSYSVPRRILLREMSGKEVRVLFEAADPLAGTRLGEYKPFTIKSADKKTDLFGYMVLPPDFDSGKKYPVILYVYGGPHAQLVLNRWLGGASGWQYYMAQQGFICVTIDNRGSDARGRDFEQVIHRNLGKAEMADQMEGIHYLSTLPWIDQDRIGVHGWSYGGFMTTSLMINYPDIFKVGAAGGPVTDWRFYEVMYGERYMDMPKENPEGYELGSTLNQVKNLRGRLLLIHGDIDPVVVWQNSLAFVRKCIDEGKLVDYMVYPRHEHNVRGKDRIHLMKTITRYFEEHL